MIDVASASSSRQARDRSVSVINGLDATLVYVAMRGSALQRVILRA